MMKAIASVTVAVGILAPVWTQPLTVSAFAGNSVIQEDDPQWDCSTMGDRVCGPLSDNAGHAPGCYSDTGTLVAPWPCRINADGSVR